MMLFFLTMVGAVIETQPPAGNLLLREGHLKISHLNNNLKLILSVFLLLYLRVMVVSSGLLSKSTRVQNPPDQNPPDKI